MDTDLQEYFRWSRSGDPSAVGYPHQDAVRRLLGSTVPSVGISDDEALWIDAALGALKGDNPDAHHVILRYYRDRKSLRWMTSNGMGCRKTLARRLSEGREFIRGYLSGKGLGTAGGRR